MGEMIRKLEKRKQNLSSERSSFVPYWRELSDYHLGFRGRFLTSDRNKGHKRNTKQYNNTSRMAARTLASGMMAGITSPARPWFRLGPPATDPQLKEYTPVKEWLFQVQQLIYMVFNHSNFYNAIHTLYSELGVFATASMGVYKDFDNVIWCKPETVGSYMLGANGRNEIDSRYREYEETVGALVKEFGYKNCSQRVQQMWDKGQTETWIKVVHVIEPNDDRDMMSPLARDKKFRSLYYEAECASDKDDKFLRRSGFDTFPLVTPRWDLTGEDIYGTSCPGMDALGDTKSLQLGEKRYAQARDKVANPTLQGPVEYRNAVAGRSTLSGSDILWVDQANGGIQSIYGNWRPDLGAIKEGMQEDELRIKRAFYEDLFLMISQSDRRQITAREIAEKQEEKLLMLGPVLERLHSELLDPVIDRVFAILNEAGALPPPPKELVGKELRVEYVSILAQAQRAVATSGMERLAEFTSTLSTIWPEARHKFDATQAVDEYGEAVGVDPRLVRGDDEAEERAVQEQQAAAAAQAGEQAEQAARAAKDASQADTGGKNALTDVMNRMGLA